MGTVIRPELSEKNKYWISKHRYYELKHFCLQYPEWKSAYLHAGDINTFGSVIEFTPKSNQINDSTGNIATIRAYYRERMAIVEQAAINADSVLYQYILKAVTEELSYTYLHTKLDIPCGKDMYYDRYRKFFWVLSKMRD